MKRLFLFVMVLILVGVGIPASTASAAEAVTFDGKNLFFPKNESIEPADISGLKFDLKLPEDKSFVMGKVYRAQFVGARFAGGQLRYILFTKWTAERIEIFIWSPDLRYPGSKPFLDCIATNDTNCSLRDTKWINFRLRFGSGSRMALISDDGWEADLKLAGTIPAQFINEHKAD
jgi:hypothetical protein